MKLKGKSPKFVLGHLPVLLVTLKLHELIYSGNVIWTSNLKSSLHILLFFFYGKHIYKLRDVLYFPIRKTINELHRLIHVLYFSFNINFQKNQTVFICLAVYVNSKLCYKFLYIKLQFNVLNILQKHTAKTKQTRICKKQINWK